MFAQSRYFRFALSRTFPISICVHTEGSTSPNTRYICRCSLPLGTPLISTSEISNRPLPRLANIVRGSERQFGMRLSEAAPAIFPPHVFSTLDHLRHLDVSSYLSCASLLLRDLKASEKMPLFRKFHGVRETSFIYKIPWTYRIHIHEY